MRTISLTAFEHLKKAHPSAEIVWRDGVETVVVPTYDLHSDVEGEQVWQLIRSVPEPKFKPGDVVIQDGKILHVKEPPKDEP